MWFTDEDKKAMSLNGREKNMNEKMFVTQDAIFVS